MGYAKLCQIRLGTRLALIIDSKQTDKRLNCGPQIGSDIAKLLGSLGKSTGSSSNSASDSESGAAFKRALAASTQAQAAQTGGKGLPVQSGRPEALQYAGTESVSVSESPGIAAQVPSDQVTTASLPGFDLQIVGSPIERHAVLKFAEEAGLSDAMLTQLFQTDGARSIDLKATTDGLAEAVANAMSDWVAAAVEQPIDSGRPQALMRNHAKVLNLFTWILKAWMRSLRPLWPRYRLMQPPIPMRYLGNWPLTLNRSLKIGSVI